jgi:hypothetical protein
LPATASSTIYETPAQAALTHSGNSCDGTAVTFTATGCVSSCSWSGSLNGTGSEMPTPNALGTYTAIVSAYADYADNFVCYSTTSSLTAVVSAPGQPGESSACGCVTGLTECGPVCYTICANVEVVIVNEENCGIDWMLGRWVMPAKPWICVEDMTGACIRPHSHQANWLCLDVCDNATCTTTHDRLDVTEHRQYTFDVRCVRPLDMQYTDMYDY